MQLKIFVLFVWNVSQIWTVSKQQLVQLANEILRPTVCLLCNERFTDKQPFDQHQTLIHSRGLQTSRQLSVAELKERTEYHGE